MTNLRKPLRRSRDGMFGGVISGLADYFEMDVTLARVLYVFGSMVSAAFPGLFVYIVMWIIVPREDLSS